MVRYVPEAGDIVWLNFTPQAGHEQAGHRPALVLSPAAYNGKTSLMICCPLTRAWTGAREMLPGRGLRPQKNWQRRAQKFWRSSDRSTGDR